MKRYKKLVPSTLVLITLVSSVVTETAYAESNIVNESEDNNIGEITTGSAIEITPALPTEKTTEAILKTLTGSAIMPKTFGTYEEDGWSYQYETDTKTARVLATNNKVGDVVIPSSVFIDGVEYTVTGLDAGVSFTNESGLTSIVIPAGVTALVEGGMFKNCVNLESVTFEGNVVRIPDNTFNGCVKLVTVNSKEGISDVGDSAFRDCTKLKNLNLSSTVSFIDTYAFYNCKSLDEIIITDGTISRINEYAFSGCTSLKKVVLPNSVKRLDMEAFSNCTQLEEVYASAVNSFGLNSHSVFKGCVSLEKVTLGNIEILPPFTFQGCTSLKEIQLPDSLKTIYNEVFVGSGLRYITIPSGTSLLVPVFITSVVSSETTEPITTAYVNTPLTGKEVSINNIAPPDAIGNTLYMKYDITPEIDLNGGEMGDDRTFRAWVTADQLADEMDTPTRDGEIFESWEIVEADTVMGADGSEYIAGCVKLKAKWLAKDSIFDTNDGTSTQTTIAQMVDENFILPATDPTREGYEFIGWFDSEDNQVTEAMVVDKFVEGTIFYAKWVEVVKEEPVINTIFDTNDGTSTQTTIAQTTGENFILPATEPTREGYEFLGWFDESDVQITKDVVVDKLEDGAVFYAKWAKKVVEEATINAIFDNNDGTSTQITIAQTTGEKFILPTVNPTREGYEFLGWFDESGVQITKDVVVDKLEDDTVFYAKWAKKVVEEATINAIFDNNDGTSIQTTIAQTTGEKFILPMVNPTREGYEFLGWFDESGVQITKDVVVDKLEDDTVFYAKWKKTSTDNTDNDTDDNTDDSTNTNTTGGNIDNNTNNNVDNNTNDGLNTDGETSQTVDPSKLLFNAFSVKAGSDEFITLYSDGTVKHTNAYTKTYIDPRTKSMYVSLRGVLDNSIDTVKINWDSKTHTAEVNFVDKGTKIVFTANSSIMTVNGVERQMLSGEGEIVEAQLSEGRLMIPLRFVSELFDFNVGYDNSIKRSVVATDRFEMKK